ncbi:MAG TPA: hypothetical protein VFV87_01140 [Pirellulaceae bacterium]|nr:hypothetical protein [Pirellulaceae bacterium]
MTTIETPQTRCLAGIARADITPPVGIYHRMWGAATHDRATGVHKPLLATLLWLEPAGGDERRSLCIASLDHCILDGPDIELMERSIADAVAMRPGQTLITLSHTHAAGLMSRSRADQPGGELIGPYLDSLATRLGQLAVEAIDHRQPATIVYGRGKCGLAANRDFFDPQAQKFVCGLNPGGIADDTLLVGRISGADNRVIGTLVNYACHPTTLAWQNTLISPDYIGALRETVESGFHAPCLFLQGASGDLGPREGYVDDTGVADRNGRQVGFAALAALATLPPAGSQFVYAGPVVSGATLGTWRHEPVDARAADRQKQWHSDTFDLPLDYRPELATKEQTQADLARWQAEEQKATAAGDSLSARDAHAQVERMTRQLWRLKSLPAGQFPLRITIAQLGDALWVFVPGEHYQNLQTALRQRFPQHPVIVATLTAGWQPGYIPTADTYGRGIYQSDIAVVAAGSAERIIDEVGRRIAELIAS